MFKNFFSSSNSTPKRTSNKKHLSLVEKEIQTIYDRVQKTLQEGVREILPKTDLEWHSLFIDSQKRKFAAIDKVDLRVPLINRINDNTIKYWIDGVFKVEPIKMETLEVYSQRAAKESMGYKSKIDEFKTETTQLENLNCSKSDEYNQIAKIALSEIKQIIESADWEIEKSDSTTTIKVAGKNKTIPNDGYRIYQLCLQGNRSHNAMELLDEIQTIFTEISIEAHLNYL